MIHDCYHFISFSSWFSDPLKLKTKNAKVSQYLRVRNKTAKEFSSWFTASSPSSSWFIAAYPNELEMTARGTGNSGRTWSLEHQFFLPENTTCSWCFTFRILSILSVNSWSNKSVKGCGHLWGSLTAAEWPCHCLAGFCNRLSNVKLIVWSRTKCTCSFIERG